MLTWCVAYWENERVIERGSERHRWVDLPVEGVLWVDVREGEYHHRLSGFDNYWVFGRSFGVFNDPENLAWYGGSAQHLAWRWTGCGSESVWPNVPDRAHVLRGVLVPDEVAWDLGLLPRGEHLPARPA